MWLLLAGSWDMHPFVKPQLGDRMLQTHGIYCINLKKKKRQLKVGCVRKVQNEAQWIITSKPPGKGSG